MERLLMPAPEHDPVGHAARGGDPVGHHAGAAAQATGLKKKVGPLPLYLWIVIVGGAIGMILLVRAKKSGSTGSAAATSGSTVDPNNPLGLTYAQEQADIAQGIDPNTGESYASEQASTDGSAAGTSSTGDSTDPTIDPGDPVTDPTDTTTHHHGNDNGSGEAAAANPVTINIIGAATPATAAKAAPKITKASVAGITAAGSAASGAGASNLKALPAKKPAKETAKKVTAEPVKIKAGATAALLAKSSPPKAAAKKVVVSGKKK
jgi:hypothetical protein